MINKEQIKAARAMLDWSQSVLAEKTGEVSTPTIKLIESGRSGSTSKTLELIQLTFEKQGLEFLPNSGIRKRDDTLTILEKKDEDDNVYLRLIDDIYYTMQGTYGEVLQSFIDNSLSPPEILHKEKLIRDDGITYRNLIRHEDTHLIYPPDEYRYLPKGFYINNPVTVYADKVAFAVLENDVRFHNAIIIINNPQIAKIKKNEFEILWNIGDKPKQTKVPEKDRRN